MKCFIFDIWKIEIQLTLNHSESHMSMLRYILYGKSPMQPIPVLIRFVLLILFVGYFCFLVLYVLGNYIEPDQVEIEQEIPSEIFRQ